MWVVFFIHPNNIKVSQIGSLRVRVSLMWDVHVKIYGNKPKKLLNIINVNRDMKIKVLPLKLLVLIKFLNSL